MVSISNHSNGFEDFFEIDDCISTCISKYAPFGGRLSCCFVVDSEQASTLDPLENTSVQTNEKEDKS